MTKILVIEDEKILREEVIEWLTLEDYEAIAAEDGMAGVEAALRELPDLIVCDVTMPRLDGHGVLLELRSTPKTADIPFIFVTARASYEDIRIGMGMGADDYITKPFSRLEFLQAIQTRLEKRGVIEQKRQREVQQWQQAFEQEREQRLLKSKLVSMFSHDFRNPLASILISNSLLRDYSERMDENRRLGHFQRVEAAVDQLLQMLDDMLVVAQLENGKLDFKPEPLNAGEFLGHIVADFQANHEETHRLLYDNHLPEAIMADSRLLRQIASNLISNAIKYSPRGSEVTIRLERQAETCILSVQDQGIGIPETDLSRLFSEFQRASNVGLIQGTGLGLTIVKQAVDLHGGSLDLQSQAGVGTTVIVRFPISPSG
jgi:two-component system sensor histidine kinase/response regulator